MWRQNLDHIVWYKHGCCWSTHLVAGLFQWRDWLAVKLSARLVARGNIVYSIQRAKVLLVNFVSVSMDRGKFAWCNGICLTVVEILSIFESHFGHIIAYKCTTVIFVTPIYTVYRYGSIELWTAYWRNEINDKWICYEYIYNIYFLGYKMYSIMYYYV